MECPKCLATCEAGSAECPHCGVVFAKLALRLAESEGLRLQEAEPSAGVDADEATAPASGAALLGRGLLLVALTWWTWEFARQPMGLAAMESVLHLPNLVFHEAGHVILGIFGQFAGVLGGSLFQVLVPLTLAGAFLRQRDWFGAAVCTWWAGQNLLDLAPYIADARALQLVLLGGKTGAEVEGHDWEYLLSQVGWLHLDRTLGLATHRLGLVVMCSALAWGAWCLSKRARPDD